MNSFSFAAPWFLAGMITLAVPFLMLLTKARGYHTTEFSSVEFLRSVIEKATNRIEWKRLLLLAARFLLLLFLALAFSLPFSRKLGFSVSNKNHFVFILDNSYSMGYREGPETLFEKAKKKIEEKVGSGSQASLYSLYTFNQHLEPLVTETGDPQFFLKRLNETALSDFAGNFSFFSAELEKITAKISKRNSVFYFFSDFSAADAKEKASFEKQIKEKTEQLTLYLISLQPKNYQNFTVEKIMLPARHFVPGKTGEIRVFYSHEGLEAGAENKMTLYMNDRHIQAKKIKIEEGVKSGDVSFDYAFSGVGKLKIKVQSEEDNLKTDNVRYAVADEHPPLRLLLVEDYYYKYPFESPYFFFSRALRSYDEDPSGQWVNMIRMPVRDLKSVDTSLYDFIVIADTVRLEMRPISKLQSFVKAGGTVLFAPGKHFSSKEFQANAALAKWFGAQFGPLEEAKKDAPFRLSPVDYNQSLLKIFEGGKQGDLGRIRFWKLAPFSSFERDPNRQTLLWFHGRWPALIEKKAGKGRLLIWTSTLNGEWTDFYKDPLYVPFIFELLKYATKKEWENPVELKVGDPISFEREAGEAQKQVFLTTPQGDQINLYEDGKSEAPFFQTTRAGFYNWTELQGGSQQQMFFPCNVDTHESKPGYLQIKKEGLKNEVFPAEAPSVRPENEFSTRYFHYHPFFYGIFSLLLIEAWIANRVYKNEWI